MLHKKRLTAVLVIMFFMKISVPAFASYDFSESWEGGSLQISLIGNVTEIAATGNETEIPVDGQINRDTSDTEDPLPEDPVPDDSSDGTDDSGADTGTDADTETRTGSVSSTDSSGEVVRTGDFSNIEVWVLIALVALFFMDVLLLRRGKSKRT